MQAWPFIIYIEQKFLQIVYKEYEQCMKDTINLQKRANVIILQNEAQGIQIIEIF